MKENNEMKEEINKTSTFCRIFNTKTMEMYRVTRKANVMNKSCSIKKTKSNRLMNASNCATCGKKKPRFIKIKKLLDYTSIKQ